MFRRQFLAILATTALASTPAFAQEDKLNVVASFSILGDLAMNVGGDRISLTTLVGRNEDAHAYEPKPDDAAKLAGAKVVLVNGLGFEGFMKRLIEASATKAEIVHVSDGIEALDRPAGMHHHDHAGEGVDHAAEAESEAGHEHEEQHADAEHDHGPKDPHSFQSVPNIRKYVGNIATAFCEADAANCDVYKGNAAAYDSKLAALDAEIRETVAGLPADKRTIITSHQAYGYFAHEYGLTFLAPEGISKESEPSAADVAKLIDQIREDKVSAVFMENISDPRLIRQIASDTGLKIGGTLFSDALSDESGPAGTYIELMRNNINTIKGAVTGS